MPRRAEKDGGRRARVLVVERRAGEADDLVGRVRGVADAEVASMEHSPDEVFVRLAEDRPDLVLVDLGSPEDSGTEVVRRVRRDFGLPIIALTETEAPPVLAEAIDAGASGFLRRSAGSATVERAIEVVLEGGFFLQPEHARGMIQQLEDLHERARHEEASLVTPREAEVLQLLSEGLSARQMARRLSLSERTVNTHVANLYRKLGVSNRVEAVRAAMRRRIVQGPK